MARYIELEWESSEIAQATDERPRLIAYRAYEPDPLRHRVFEFTEPLRAEIDRAEQELTRLRLDYSNSDDREKVIERFAAAEAAASSKIDDIQTTEKRLAEALEGRIGDRSRYDRMTQLILANVDAMIEIASGIPNDITVGDICKFRDHLLLDQVTEPAMRDLRSTAKWTGGEPGNPKMAAFVAPPPELVPELMHDLCDFCNREDLPPVAQAAIAHGQFETIHPFVTANGRTGRGLVFMVLKRRGIIADVMPPVSLVLDAQRREYSLALQASRYDGDQFSASAARSASGLISLFAAAFVGAVDEAQYL